MMSFLACLLISAACSTQPSTMFLFAGRDQTDKFHHVRATSVGIHVPRVDFAWGDVGWEADIGVLGARDGVRDAVMLAVGPAVRYVIPLRHGRLLLEAASRPTFITESFLDMREIGGNFHFTSHAGLHWEAGWPIPGFDIVLRVSHMSNAGIRADNPGLDMIYLGVGAQIPRL